MAEETKERQEQHKNLHASKAKVEGKKLEKTKLQKAASAFFAEDIDMVKGSIVDDYMQPRIQKAREDGIRKFKEFLFDSIMGIFEIILFGAGKGRDSGSGIYRGKRINYNRMSDGRSESRYRHVDPDDDPISRTSNRVEIYTASFDKNKEILFDLNGYIRQYDSASVADYYQLIGAPMNETDYYYGWVEPIAADIAYDPRSGEYYLKLPRPVALPK